MQTLVFDIETTKFIEERGVWRPPEKVHMLAARDVETKMLYKAVGHKEVGELALEIQNTAKTIIAHNGIGFDYRVLEHHYGFDRRKLRCWDSLILCRMFHMNVGGRDGTDLKRIERDKHLDDSDIFKFTGKMHGKHALEAWGLRLSPPCPKGTYAEDMERKGIDPWAEYNEDMDTYCVQDVDVLMRVWEEKLVPEMRPDVIDACIVEHIMAEMMVDVKTNGIKFNEADAHKLVAELQQKEHEFLDRIRQEFPPRLEPVKWEYTPRDVNGYTALMMKYPDNKVYRPKFNLPEGYDREQWGQVTTYKNGYTARDKTTKEVLYTVGKYEHVEGFEYGNNAITKCALKEFNPGSRGQIIERLLELGWHPEEFTETNNPSTDADTLTKLDEDFPAAKSIVNYLMVQKRLGQVKTGEKAWLNLVDPQGFIHPTIIPCNAITHRGTHADPNISQVPSVKMVKVLDANGNVVKKPDGEPELEIGWGQKGKWGADCRALFTVPDGFDMVGVDLSGIELRCWAHYLYDYDGGILADIILNQDIHENNRRILGFNDRRDAKSFLFALMYGAGDEKLGSIIEPLSPPARQKAVGKQARSRFMSGIRGFEDLSSKLKRDARRGYLIGLDRRRLYIRKEHAALNTLLQGAGAILSKYWIIIAMRGIEDELGLKLGYNNDFSLMIYSHDELQFAVRKQYTQKLKQIVVDAAGLAGEYLGMRLPIAAEGKHGDHWTDTH
jgi:hypothetical protein